MKAFLWLLGTAPYDFARDQADWAELDAGTDRTGAWVLGLLLLGLTVAAGWGLWEGMRLRRRAQAAGRP